MTEMPKRGIDDGVADLLGMTALDYLHDLDLGMLYNWNITFSPPFTNTWCNVGRASRFFLLNIFNLHFLVSKYAHSCWV